MHVADWYTTYAMMAGVEPTDAAGEAAGVPAVDGLNMLPLLLGTNTTSPRTEIFFTKDCLIDGDWKLLTGAQSSASWPGPTYPNASTAASNNTLDRYSLKCNTACLFNVAEDMTEHDDLAAAHPDIVTKMLARLADLTETIWDNKWTGFSSTCIPTSEALKLHSGFLGPFCELGPLPPSPPSPPSPPPPAPPGPFPPTPLNNCTYLPNTWVDPPSHETVDAATKEACCSACGMNPSCVAAVLTCKDSSGKCTCNLKLFNPKYTLSHKTNTDHTTLTCLTGRQNITA